MIDKLLSFNLIFQIISKLMDKLYYMGVVQPVLFIEYKSAVETYIIVPNVS